MSTFAVVAAVVAAWLLSGLLFTTPRAIARAVRNRISGYESMAGPYTPPVTARQIAEWRREAVGDNILMIAAGPLPLAFFALHDWLYRSAPLTEIELRQALKEREQRIADLEAGSEKLRRELKKMGIDS